MKSLLFVAFHFPPCAGSGTLRSLKFSKFLPEHGWRPVVLTVPESLHVHQDAQLLSQMPPGSPILRARAYDSARSFGVVGKYPSFAAVPDRYITWLPFAVRAGTQAVTREDIAAVYTTSPVPTAHLIGLALKRRFDLPWVVDLRDPWATPPTPGRTRLRARIEQSLERRAFAAADAIVVTCGEFRECLLGQIQGLTPSKVHVVSNGFDEDDFPTGTVPPSPPGRKFVLSHIGQIYPALRNPQSFFLALRDLVSEHPALRDTLEVVLVGSRAAYFRSVAFASRLSDLGLANIVTVLDQTTHAKAIEHALQSDALLLFQQSPDARFQIPAKAYEYLRASRPVLTLAPEGATSRLMLGSGVGPVVAPDNVAAIKAALHDVIFDHDSWVQGVQTGLHATAFDRRYLTGKLAAILDEVCRSAAHSRRPS